MNRFLYTLAAAFLVVMAALLWLRGDDFLNALNAFGQRSEAPQPDISWTKVPELPEGAGAPGDGRLRHIVRSLLKPGAIAYEAILSFDSRADLEAFLKNSGGLKVLGSLPELGRVRVGYDDIDDLKDIPDNAETAPNYLVQLPTPPSNQGPGIQDSAVPFGSSALGWLGVGENENWGLGKKIAIIDTGVEAHTTFGETQVGAFQDFVSEEEGVNPEVNGHGTAVASVAAGSHPAAPGVAPAAEVLSYRVADGDGNSDSFTLAEGILAAVADGADVINISMGSTGNSSVVEEAIAAALEAGSTVVAAAGNNGTHELTYPAAYEGVISVGSIDALGQHLEFSNTSEDLNISAPGYEVPAAWPGEQVIQFTGTSASAPFVSGSIAAIMSMDPSLTGQQAYDLLVTHANEAGAPGYDGIYGDGILNVGRVVQAGESGIYDAAVASHYYAGDVEGNGREILQVVVENRGTEPLQASTLVIGSPLGEQQYTLGPIKPGDVLVREVVVDTRQAEIQGSVDYSTTLSLPSYQTDVQLGNNQLTSTFVDPALSEVPQG